MALPPLEQGLGGVDGMRVLVIEDDGFALEAIRDALEGLMLAPGVARIPDNLRRCYGALVDLGVVGREELQLLEAWLEDIGKILP